MSSVQISSFRQTLVRQSSIALRSQQRSHLATPHGSALARHTLAEVVEYVRFCHDYDDNPLGVREERTLNDLEALASPAHRTSVSISDATYIKALHRGLRTAHSLMKSNNLWLAHNDTDRRVIISALGELGFHLDDHSIDTDPIDPTTIDEESGEPLAEP
jgi:hypothetical protein